MDTVLIVDDSSFIVEGLISFLKKKYRTLAAYGGAECLTILARERPSVIILDILMEPMDGWETLARIKENPKTRTIPVLMFSAQKISVEEAAEHGICIDDFIQKPVFPKQILEAIEKVIARRDTNLKMVETWKAAGISQEKIDEYLTLVTSLEVDLSLCQNMKIQCDLSHPEDNDQIQVRALIAAIEDRIRQERGMIESLVLGMNDVLLTRPGRGKSAGAFSEDPHGSDPDPADAITSDTPPVSRPVPDHPDHGTAGTDQTLAPLEPDSVPPGSPAGTVPVRAEIPTPLDTAIHLPIPPVTGTVEAGFLDHGGNRPDEESRVRTTHPKTANVPGFPPASPLLPADDPPITDQRKVIPADLDLPPEHPGKAQLTGAGTDVPMPWDTQRERKPLRLLSTLAGKNGSVVPGSTTPPNGIIARIISFVLSLVRKRN
jgi:CheY-like chemotaxis protein